MVTLLTSMKQSLMNTKNTNNSINRSIMIDADRGYNFQGDYIGHPGIYDKEGTYSKQAYFDLYLKLNPDKHSTKTDSHF